MKLIASSILIVHKIIRRLYMYVLRNKFKKVGPNFIFNPYDNFSYETIEVGEDVYIGPGATLNASNSGILIGNKVMFGPNVTIMGGDHNFSTLGKYMFDVKSKKFEDDKQVIIKNDVWLGAGSTILKGTTINEGAVVAAGSIVTRDVPPYAIVAGIPAKVIKYRFNKEQIDIHKERLK